MERTVRIGAASAFFNDSRMGIAQLLAKGGPLDYIIFDFLAESVMGSLGRSLSTGSGPGFATDFIDGYLLPHLSELAARGIRIIANAGGLDPAGSAQSLRDKAAAIGLTPRIGHVSGDNLTDRHREIVNAATRDMFDDTALLDKVVRVDRVNSLVAYTGAFPIAAALKAGADIVLTGRAVDSALTLGALIHEFDWAADDLDRLAAGTLAGHLLECSAQVTGGTFTDWRDVPDWAGIGMPIAECRADGSLTITKPEGTGGIVTIGTVSEQMLYEVSDPQRYYVADVVCDFSGVTLVQSGADRVEVAGVRGLGRTATFKASLTFDRGWRASALIPITGLEARAKAKRVGEELFGRVGSMLASAQMPPFEQIRCDVIGGGAGEDVAICRIVADHALAAGADLLVREQGSAISHMSVGISMGLGASVRPIQHIAGFLLSKDSVQLEVVVDGRPVPCIVPANELDVDLGASSPTQPALPTDAAEHVPLIQLAWARSGDKGNLFNVAVIARDPSYLPYIAASLTPEAVGAHYAARLGGQKPFEVDCYNAPGLCAINFVVRNSMEGGVLASMTLDPVAKGMAQLLLDYPIAVSSKIYQELALHRSF